MKTISIFKTTLIATSAALVFSASSFAQEKSATKPTEANVEQSANKAAKEKLNQFNAAETVADIDVGSVESRGAAQARSTGLGAIIAVGAANSDQDVFDADAKRKDVEDLDALYSSTGSQVNYDSAGEAASTGLTNCVTESGAVDANCDGVPDKASETADRVSERLRQKAR